MNKKAVFDVARKSIYWTIAGVIIVAVILAYAIILTSYSNRLTEVPAEFEAELVLLRFLHTEDCFGVDGMPDVIDLAKFTNATVNFCYMTDEEKGHRDMNFQFELPLHKKAVKTNNYFNKVDFTVFKNVLVKEGDEITPTQLIVYVQEKI